MATPLQNRNKILALAEQRIKLLYADAYTRALKIAEVRKALDAATDSNFTFKANPRAQKELEKIMGELSIDLKKMAESGFMTASKNGLSVATQRILAITASANAKDMTAEAAADNRLSQAMGTRLANAKRGGLTLSERIWKSVQTSRNELEIIIQNNIIQGKGADVASREVRQYLNDPKKLFRRVKDKETGEYRLSKAAQQYHPGQGKYRSSYMNARRLMVTEMNMATQASECAAYADNPLIAGYEIRLSNNHTVKDPRHKGEVLPLHDICDELQGKYPPTFKFTCWHPMCRCTMIPILISAEERRKLAQARAEGKPYQPKGVITDVPDNFKSWVAANQDRIMSAKTLPFFLQDNGELTKDGYVLDEKFATAEPEPTQEPKAEQAPEIVVDDWENSTLKPIIESLENSTKIANRDVEKYGTIPTEEEIIQHVGGGDLTRGSCSSLAYTYLGNKGGLNVLDFRDGESRIFFATNLNIRMIAEAVGGTVTHNTNDFVSAAEALKTVEQGKEYYFACGKHAAVVRKTEKSLEFLELQSAKYNGWKELNKTALQLRFGAKRSHSTYGHKFEMATVLVESELLYKNGGFKKMLEFINTAEGAQRKGTLGTIK